jgi:hypothetical protein
MLFDMFKHICLMKFFTHPICYKAQKPTENKRNAPAKAIDLLYAQIMNDYQINGSFEI